MNSKRTLSNSGFGVRINWITAASLRFYCCQQRAAPPIAFHWFRPGRVDHIGWHLNIWCSIPSPNHATNPMNCHPNSALSAMAEIRSIDANRTCSRREVNLFASLWPCHLYQPRISAMQSIWTYVILKNDWFQCVSIRLTNASMRFVCRLWFGRDCADGMTMSLNCVVDEGCQFAALLGRLPSLLNDWLATVPAEDVSEQLSHDWISSQGISSCGIFKNTFSLNPIVSTATVSRSVHVWQSICWYLLRSSWLLLSKSENDCQWLRQWIRVNTKYQQLPLLSFLFFIYYNALRRSVSHPKCHSFRFRLCWSINSAQVPAASLGNKTKT